MKRISLFFLLTCTATVLAAQGYRITARYKPVPDGKLYLGYYFGNQKYVLDSAALQPNGEAVFTGAEKLTGGLYLIVVPKK